MKTLGKDAIIREMKNGACLYRVSGKFGGWGISDASDWYAVRTDSCFKLMSLGLLKVKERRGNCVEYELADKEA